MPTAAEPVAAWATDCRDKYPENHDSGFAGRLCLSDGSLVWAAVVSDGAGGSMEGLKVSALAVQAFTDAVRRSTLAELSDPAARDAWSRTWTKALHAEAFGRFKGGMATFCGAVLLPPAAGGAGRPGEPPRPDGADWKLFALNVGDSQVWRLTGDGKCLGIVPDAPPNNANVEGHNPIRVVGVAPKGDFALLDIEEFPLPKEGPVWVLAGSDGFFSKKKGKDELCIFSSGDMRDLCLDPAAPFHELPARAIRRSLANAQKLGCAEMMDNATVAMLGFRVPPTDLRWSVQEGGAGRPGEPQVQRRAAEPQRSVEGRAGRPGEPPRPGEDVSPHSERQNGAEGSSGRASRPGEPQRGKAVRSLAAVAFFSLLLGLLLGRSCAPARSAASPTDSVHVSASASPLPPVKVRGSIPDEGRCRYCWAHRDKLPEGETPYHWAKDCPHRDKWAPL